MEEVKVGQVWVWNHNGGHLKIELNGAEPLPNGMFRVSGTVLENKSSHGYVVGETWQTSIVPVELHKYNGSVGFMKAYHWKLEQDPVVNSSGLNCQKCQMFYSYVIPNQSDNTYICYNCRL